MRQALLPDIPSGRAQRRALRGRHVSTGVAAPLYRAATPGDIHYSGDLQVAHWAIRLLSRSVAETVGSLLSRLPPDFC